MSLLDRLERWLGGEVDDDPDRLVAVASVAPYRAPVLHQALVSAGLVPHERERFDAVTGLTSTILLVPRKRAADAERVLAELQQQPG